MGNTGKIGYSLLREFASFLENLAEYKKFTQKKWEEPDDLTREITKKAHDQLSPSLKADLKLFVKDTVLYTYPLFAPAVMRKAADFGEYLVLTEEMDAGEYVRFFLECYDIEIPKGNDEERITALEEIFKRVDQGERILESYEDLKRYPVEQMARARSFFTRVYEEFFLSHERRIETFLQEKSQQHNLIREKDPPAFKKELVKIKLDGRDEEKMEYDYMVGCMTMHRTSYTPQGNRVLVFYSYRVEQTFDPAHMDNRMAELFKALGDDSRLAIVQALAVRPRYSSELSKELNLTRGTLSHHMNILNRFNIFTIQVGERKRVYYSLDKEKLGTYFSRFLEILGGN